MIDAGDRCTAVIPVPGGAGALPAAEPAASDPAAADPPAALGTGAPLGIPAALWSPGAGAARPLLKPLDAELALLPLEQALSRRPRPIAGAMIHLAPAAARAGRGETLRMRVRRTPARGRFRADGYDRVADLSWMLRRWMTSL